MSLRPQNSHKTKPHSRLIYSVPMRRYRYLDALTTAFVVFLLISNLVAQKVFRVGPFGFIPAFSTSGSMLLFPITYIFGDVFTEIYGYSASRRAIWLGFFGTALMYAVAAAVIALPPDPEFKHQEAFVTVFGILPRILIASLIAFWAGEFANSYTMAKLKLLTKGRWLWTRTIGSTAVGQFVDTTLVIFITFAGTFSTHKMVEIILTGYILKVLYETAATPLTYLVINFLKRAEHANAFDTNTDFNPFQFAGDKTDSVENL